MPAGTSEICATVNGKPGRRTVIATREACERLQADLQEQLRASAAGEKARPMLMFDHRAGNAAAKPLGFEWDEKRGILLRVEWTQAGREAVEGGNYGYISPVFNLSRSTGEIIGLSGGVEVGSLVNDPAFERNECIAASRSEEAELIQVEYLVAANPYGCNQYGHREGHQGGEGNPDLLKYLDKDALRRSVEKIEKEKATPPDFGEINGRDVIRRMDDERKWKERDAWMRANRGVEGWRASKDDLIAYLQYKINEARSKGHDTRSLEDELRRVKEIDENANKKTKFTLPERMLAANASVPPQAEIANGPARGHNDNNPRGLITHTNPKMDEIKKMLGLGPKADDAAVLAAIRALKASGAEAVSKTETLEAECEQHKKALTAHKEQAANSFVKRLQKDGTIGPHDEERAKAARTLYMTDPEQAEVLFCGLTSKQADIYREEVKANRVPSRSGQVDNYKNLTLEELLNDN